jgi:hypothetical protein
MAYNIRHTCIKSLLGIHLRLTIEFKDLSYLYISTLNGRDNLLNNSTIKIRLENEIT